MCERESRGSLAKRSRAEKRSRGQEKKLCQFLKLHWQASEKTILLLVASYRIGAGSGCKRNANKIACSKERPSLHVMSEQALNHSKPVSNLKRQSCYLLTKTWILFHLAIFVIFFVTFRYVLPNLVTLGYDSRVFKARKSMNLSLFSTHFGAKICLSLATIVGYCARSFVCRLEHKNIIVRGLTHKTSNNVMFHFFSSLARSVFMFLALN